MQLYIGNKNYSSWSLRPWLLLTELGIDFEEIGLRLDSSAGSAFKNTLLRLAPSGRVPLLVDDGFAVWDSLAIIEYIADKYPHKPVWPRPLQARARARSLCAEMHAGFAALREHWPMNIEASLPEVGPRSLAEHADVASDLERVETMWREQLDASGGPFLFGEFGAVDAYYAPVCARFASYAPPLGATTQAYLERIFALGSMRAWVDAARAEHDFLAVDEPYRSAPA